jgi:Spy/CpxP family protein refolding chaperone
MRRMLIPVLLAMPLSATRTAHAQKCGQPFEVAVGTPSSVIARTVVDQMFDEIVLTDAQQAKAVDIVTKFIDSQPKPGDPDRKQKVDSLSKKRNEDLLALLTKDADKAKLSACFKKEEDRRAGRSGGSTR